MNAQVNAEHTCNVVLMCLLLYRLVRENEELRAKLSELQEAAVAPSQVASNDHAPLTVVCLTSRTLPVTNIVVHKCCGQICVLLITAILSALDHCNPQCIRLMQSLVP